MAAIKQLFHIAAPSQKVYEALSTIDGLSNWWTKQTTGESKTGSIIEFKFDSMGHHIMKVLELKPNELVKWECLGTTPDWIGTILTFQLDDHDGKTRVRFSHDRWKEANDSYANCSFSWALFMVSLRNLCQTGKGEAYGSENYRR